MNTEQLEQYLVEVFDWSSSEDGEIKSIETFEEREISTTIKGIVLTMRDQSEFQLQIVKVK
jgi:hypothetical protein